MIALSAKNITKKFSENIVLADLSISLEASKIYGLIGPSGSGKSVLLKTLAGIYPPDGGTITSNYKTISLMFQEGALFDSMSILDNVAFPLVNGSVPVSNLPSHQRTKVGEQVSYILERVGLLNAAHKMPSQISGGMRKRASLARALVARPDVVFLDDPTSGLDPVSSNVIMKLITDLHSEYKPTMILVSHDLRRLLPQVERIFAMFKGKIIFEDDLDNLRKVEQGSLRDFVSCRFDLARFDLAGTPS